MTAAFRLPPGPEASHRALAATFAWLRDVLAGTAGAEDAPDITDTALDRLARHFGLSGFERNLVALCAGAQIDGGIAVALGGPPSFGIAMGRLPDAHWSAVLPSSPIRHWRLATLEPGLPFAAAALRLDETILHYITGFAVLDERLACRVRPVAPADDLAPSQAVLAKQVAACATRGGDRTPMVVNLHGTEGGAALAASAFATAGLASFALSLDRLPADPAERADWLRLWERDARLMARALLIDSLGAGRPADPPLLNDLLQRLGGALVMLSAEPITQLDRPVLHLAIDRPTRAEQVTQWRAQLGAVGSDNLVDDLVETFDLGASRIAAAAAEARLSVGQDGAPETRMGAAVWAACRAQARESLDGLARRIVPRADWADLTLPPRQTDLLRRVVAQARHRRTVYRGWGFAERLRRGLGITVLLAGASGVGKSLAAEVLAHELGIDLYTIDLSAIVSKYIGETSKHLQRIFAAAEAAGAVLLFDEADAVFSRRTDVKDSHDRYANIEASYLLQRMEEYDGIAVLTTNMKDAIDGAFLRRIRFVVDVPFPGRVEREAIWRRMFPPGAPLVDVDFTRLAQLELPGGNIRNVALGAAFRAAEAPGAIDMNHLLDAARDECAKIGRPLAPRELVGWV